MDGLWAVAGGTARSLWKKKLWLGRCNKNRQMWWAASTVRQWRPETDHRSVSMMTQGHVMEKKQKWILSELESLCFLRKGYLKKSLLRQHWMQTERKEFKQLHVFVLESLPGVQLTEQLQKEQKKKKKRRKNLRQKWCVYSSWFFGREVTSSVYKKNPSFPFLSSFPESCAGRGTIRA